MVALEVEVGELLGVVEDAEDDRFQDKLPY
jgi:hypothetical protein